MPSKTSKTRWHKFVLAVYHPVLTTVVDILVSDKYPFTPDWIVYKPKRLNYTIKTKGY